MRPRTPTGRPYPSAAQAGRERLGRNRRCVGEGTHRVSPNPHGASLSLRGPGRTGGTRVQPPLCGGGTSPCAPEPPRNVPIPPRPRQDPRDSVVTAAVWGREPIVCPQTPTGRPYPSAAQAEPGGDSGVTAAVWGRDLSVCPRTPTERPYPSAAQAGPEGLGCNRRCVGERTLRASSKPPRGGPIPPRPRQDRRDSGVTAAVWGRVPPDPYGPLRANPVSAHPMRGPGDWGATDPAGFWGDVVTTFSALGQKPGATHA